MLPAKIKKTYPNLADMSINSLLFHIWTKLHAWMQHYCCIDFLSVWPELNLIFGFYLDSKIISHYQFFVILLSFPNWPQIFLSMSFFFQILVSQRRGIKNIFYPPLDNVWLSARHQLNNNEMDWHNNVTLMAILEADFMNCIFIKFFLKSFVIIFTQYITRQNTDIDDIYFFH